ncbi:MAG: helix-turn-helix domain-containing protein [Candidatus Micrarchaeia archaeon]
MDTEILEEIGLTPGEIKAYLALMKLKSSATGEIARRSGVSRSKIYAILDKLEKKGLASHVDKNGVRHFQAVEPGKIRDYLHEKEKELERMRESLERFLPSLESYYSEDGSSHSVTVYEGVKGLKVAHEHSYLKLRKGQGYCVLGVPEYTPWEKINYWDHDHRRRADAGIACRMLFNTDASKELLEHKNRFALCNARYMPIDNRGPAYFEIFADTTLIIIPHEEPITIEIVSNDIADSFRQYFEGFWKRSKPFR